MNVLNSYNKYSKYIQLFIISFLSLFIELYVIRFLGCNFRIFIVFKTLPLIACFLGLGVGFNYQKTQAFKLAPFALFLFILSAVMLDYQNIGLCGFPSVANFQWQNHLFENLSFSMYLVIIPVLCFGPFFLCYTIGSQLGILFTELPALPAYSVDLLGAICGSIIFSVLAYAQFSLTQLLIIPIFILIIYSTGFQLKSIKWYFNIAILVLTPLLMLIPIEPKFTSFAPVSRQDTQLTYWSPLQRIDSTLFHTPNHQIFGLELGVNRAHYQFLFTNSNLDFINKLASKRLKGIITDRISQYEIPFTFSPQQKLDNVLIIGAGTGQNVLAAVQNKAKHIDAVEIDPVIIKLGKLYNPSFHNDNVRIINDDARHFLNTTKQKYDLIIFATLDSHSVSGQGSSVRLDCYVYTKESLESAKRLLNPDGYVFLNFASGTPWIRARLINTVRAVFGDNLLILTNNFKYYGSYDLSFIYNPTLQLNNIYVSPDFIKINPKPVNFSHKVLTDDYPFLYVQPDVIDWYYLIILGEILILSLIPSYKVFVQKSNALYWQLFFLGAGFLLLELTNIARLTLIYGTTWFTSALVINGILIMTWIANLIVINFKPLIEKFQIQIYCWLFFLLLISKFIMVNNFLLWINNYYLGSFILMIILILPVFFAGLIFPIAFAKADSQAKAFTYNLLGAILGGILEYCSFYIGNSWLIIISASLYLISFMFYLKFTKKKNNYLTIDS